MFFGRRKNFQFHGSRAPFPGTRTFVFLITDMVRCGAIEMGGPENSYMDRLNKVATRQTVRLTHYGRKSGKPYEVTIWFVVNGNRVYLGTANVNRQWVRNVQKTPKVRSSIGGEMFEGQGPFLTDRTEQERAKMMMRRKYWMYGPVFAVARGLMAIRLLQDRTGSFEGR
jgi:deazaflavin-dependent oxidoreductase (nitroreductase family)